MEPIENSQIREINNKVTSILTLLQGNELDKKDMGMAGVQAEHEERIKALENFKSKAINIAIGAGFPAAWGLFDMLYKLFTK